MVAGRLYEFRVQPAVPEKARDAFCDMVIGGAPGGTVLRGTVMDDSHLHGILEQFRALSLTVLEACPLDRFVEESQTDRSSPAGDARPRGRP